MNEARAAYMGAPGAFGEQACRVFLPGLRPLPRDNFDCVVDAVLSGEAQKGLIPVENRIAGRVPGAEAALARDGIKTVDQGWLPVSLHLVGLPGARVEELELVSSHQVALAQCERLIQRLGVGVRACSSTSTAAGEVKAVGDPRQAALASEAAAKLYGLSILARDAQDQPGSATCFAIIAKSGAP